MQETYDNLIEKMRIHTESENPKECVGIITKDFDYIPCLNLSENPEDSFILDPVAFHKYENNCWGVYHSHPKETSVLPSEADDNETMLYDIHHVVGNGKQFIFYWRDKKINAIRVERFKKYHLVSSN